jgi:Integrase core domain
LGKVERFHQTLKRFLAKQPPADTITKLQTQIDEFINYYNQIRPHRAKDRKTPISAFNSRDKARPSNPDTPTTGVKTESTKPVSSPSATTAGSTTSE